jgi:hypothetical protein
MTYVYVEARSVRLSGLRRGMRGNLAPGRGFEPRLTDPEPAVRGGDAAIQMVSGFTPRALLHVSRLSTLCGRLQHARQHEIYPKCAEMTMIAREWLGIVCAAERVLDSAVV